MADGPDDASLVIDLLLDHPSCIRCLTATAAIGAFRLGASLVAIERAIELHRVMDRCRRRGTIDTVFFVDRSR